MIGAHRINSAPVCITETPAVCMLPDAIAVPKGIQIVSYETHCGSLKEICDRRDFVRADVYGSGLSGAACPAALACKTKTFIEKMGTVEI